MAVKRLTASGVIGATAGQAIIIYGATLVAAGDAATAKLKDAEADTGDESISLATAANTSKHDNDARGRGFLTRGYCVLTGTSPICLVHYEPVKGQ